MNPGLDAQREGLPVSLVAGRCHVFRACLTLAALVRFWRIVQDYPQAFCMHLLLDALDLQHPELFTLQDSHAPSKDSSH